MQIAVVSHALRVDARCSSRCLRRVSRVGELFDVVHYAKQLPWPIDFRAPAQREAIAGMAPHLTLIMFGSNEELWEQTGQKGMRSRLRDGLMIRAKIARRSGNCVIIPHAPNPRSKSLQRSFQKTAQKAAADAHCIYAPLLDSIWPGASSQATGLTYDGIHPTAKGYDLMARRLARFIASRL